MKPQKKAAQRVAATPAPAALPAGMTLEMWPIDRPIPYARNARKLSASAVEKIAASLQEFGWQQPIVVDTEDVIVVGHTRLMAAKHLRMVEVPVHVAAKLTPGQIKAYRIMDNRSHQETTWDFDLLPTELLELKGLDFDLGLTGFAVDEIGKFLDNSKGTAEAGEPRAAGQHQAGEEEAAPAPPNTGIGNAEFGYNIVFDDYDQQQTWFGFLRVLEALHAQKTTGARLTAHIQAHCPGLGGEV